jgi:hypothetical protein
VGTEAERLMSAHVLYRCFDSDGGLLYIGITGDPGNRFAVHECLTPWWADVAKIDQDSDHASRAELEEAERAAIRAEHPFYNVKDNPCSGCPTCFSPSPHFFPRKAIYGAFTAVFEGEEPFVICTDPFHYADHEGKAQAERIHANRDQLIEMGVLRPAPKMPVPAEWAALGALFEPRAS